MPSPRRITEPMADPAESWDAAKAYVRACVPWIAGADLDDAVQDGWLAYLGALPRLTGDQDSHQGFLNVCALNAARNQHRRGLRGDPCPLDELPPMAAPGTFDVGELVEQRERLRLVDELRPLRRRAMIGRAIGLSYDELAHATGSTYTAINRHTAEGRGELRALDA